MIPTVVDTSRYTPKQHLSNQDIVLGWMGHPVNFPFLEGINPALSGLHKKYPNISLLVRLELNCFYWHLLVEHTSGPMLALSLSQMQRGGKTNGTLCLMQPMLPPAPHEDSQVFTTETNVSSNFLHINLVYV